ncbi:MAG: hypothetical protein ACRC8S_13790 [Fimbriiglobus sp.]
MPGKHPALNLAEATRNLLPDAPLQQGDEWYVDLAPARGDRGRSLLKKEFERKGDEFLFAIFASHRGVGKSTELLRLQHELKKRYECIHLYANTEFESDNFDLEDFLLVLCRVVEEHMRKKVQKPIPMDVLKPVEDWFSEITKSSSLGTEFAVSVQSGIEAKAEIPFFAKLFTSFSALVKSKSEHKTSFKSVVRKYPGALAEAANNLLKAAGAILSPSDRELLIVVDNMDRYKPAPMDEFLAGEPDTLKSLQANFVVTPPVSLIYRPISERLGGLYRTFVLPSPKLRNANDSYDTVGPPAFGPLLEVLKKRMDLDRLIPDSDARKRLVLASGGAVRELIDFTRQATLVAEGEVITPSDIEYVITKERSSLRDQINISGYWTALAEMAATKKLIDNPKCLDLLYYRMAMQFNGENWYDIHALIAELPDFQRALQAVNSQSGRLVT